MTHNMGRHFNMKTHTSQVGMILLIAAAFVVALYAYPTLPQDIVSHWNAAGVPNGTMPKYLGLLVFPGIMVFIFLISLVLPHIDPLRGIANFPRAYNAFFFYLTVFLFYVFALSLAWNFGAMINLDLALSPALAALWFFVGVLLPQTHRNWFVGIRTPWTLSSDAVWNKTHALGGKLFRTAGLIALLGIFFLNKWFLFFTVGPVILFAVVLIVYSYVEYRKEERR